MGEKTTDNTGNGINIPAVIIMILLAGGMYYMEVGGKEKSHKQPKPTAKQSLTQRQGLWAPAVAKHFVKMQLKSPTTAKIKIKKMGKSADNTWWVAGTVDAQNGFGAMIRATWYIDMTADPACPDYTQYHCWTPQQPPIINTK